MNSDLKIIKRHYGEAMMYLCREFFAILLEEEGLLAKLMLDNFEDNHYLAQDIIENDLEINFKNYIYSLVNVEVEEASINKTPQELMGEAGYDLYECLSEEDIQSFRKYYAPNEELCTFRGGRLKTARVFFAVKKNVDEIKREDFTKPERQDEYGTSVISIQFSLDGSNTLSIKNRYNHRVNNPDATFKNNLDNIKEGLTKSFEDYYGIIQKRKNKNFEIPNYVRANDGKYYKYNYEIDNIYYCPNNVIINNFEVERYEKEKYIIIDYFILDLKNKIVYSNAKDAFLDSLKDIERIEIRKFEEGKDICLIPKKGQAIELEIDNLNRLRSYKNNNLREIGDDFLFYNKYLENLELPNVKYIKNFFGYSNECLKNIDLSNVEYIGKYFLDFNNLLTSINLANVKYIGDSFLFKNTNLKDVYMPNVREIKDFFLFYNNSLKRLYLPKVKKVGAYFLTYNDVLFDLNLPALEEAGKLFLHYNPDFKINDLKESFSRRRVI